MKYKEAKYKVDKRMKDENKSIVYTLSVKGTSDIFYVGVTSMPNSRLTDHKKRFGKDIVLEEVETIQRPGVRLGYVHATQIETYWIGQFTEWGFDLANKYDGRSRKTA